MTVRAAYVLVLAAAMTAAAPASAGWKLVNRAAPAVVAKSTVKVTPAEDWNRWTTRPVPKSEVWTLDGPALNELMFWTGIIPGETLYRDMAKKDRPLPKMRAGMQLTDIPDFLESSVRVQLDTSSFEITGTEPVRFAGRDGIRFTYTFATGASNIVRKGVAQATLAGGSLTMIGFTAPEAFYFERDRARAEALMASASM